MPAIPPWQLDTHRTSSSLHAPGRDPHSLQLDPAAGPPRSAAGPTALQLDPRLCSWTHALQLDPRSATGPTLCSWTQGLQLCSWTQGLQLGSWTHALQLDPRSAAGPTLCSWTHALCMQLDHLSVARPMHTHCHSLSHFSLHGTAIRWFPGCWPVNKICTHGQVVIYNLANLSLIYQYLFTDKWYHRIKEFLISFYFTHFSLTGMQYSTNSYWYSKLIFSRELNLHDSLTGTNIIYCVHWIVWYEYYFSGNSVSIYLLSHAHAINNTIYCIPQTYVIVLSYYSTYTQVRALSIYKVSYHCSFYLNHNLVLGRWKDDRQLFLSFFGLASLDTYTHAHNYTNDN